MGKKGQTIFLSTLPPPFLEKMWTVTKILQRCYEFQNSANKCLFLESVRYYPVHIFNYYVAGNIAQNVANLQIWTEKCWVGKIITIILLLQRRESYVFVLQEI